MSVVRSIASVRARALDLAKRGFHVFPVGKNKKPLTKKGQYSDSRWSASNDLATVQHMFGRFPTARIGLATGESKLVVIDLDKKTGGLEWLAENEHILCDYIVRTPSGGLHLYYRARPDREVRDSASVIAPGVDVRGEGGFVVAYDDVESGSIDAISRLPDTLYKAAIRKRSGMRVDFSRAHPSQGERSDRLIKFGGALVAKGKSWAIVEKRVRQEAEHCNPPFDDDELERTVLKSLRTYYEEEHAPRPPRKLRSKVSAEIDQSEERLLLTAEQLNERQDLPPQLVEGLLEQQTEASIVGPAGAAKSLVALELGLAIATGKRFFSHKTHQGPVLYLCGEGAGGIRRRFQALCAARGIDPRGVPFAVLPKSFDLEGPEIEDALDEFEKRYGALPIAIIIDTYSRYVGRENDENASGDLYAFFAMVGEVFGGIARVILHHTGHGDAKRSRGTSAWSQAVDTEFVLNVSDDPPTFESVRTLENTKQKDGELAEPKYFKLHRVATRTKREGRTLWSVVLEETEPPEEQKTAHEGRTAKETAGLRKNQLSAIALIVKHDGEARAEIIDRMLKKGMQRTRVYGVLKSLRLRGFCVIDGEGRIHATSKAKSTLREQRGET